MESDRIRVKVKDKNGLDTKLFIIQSMVKYKEPISMYRFAKDHDMSTAQIFYHFNSLVKNNVIVKCEDGFELNVCFKHINLHLEKLVPFFQSIADDNPDLDIEDLNILASFMLAISTIEVE